MKTITENNIRVLKHRLKLSDVPNYNRLVKIKDFVAKEELEPLVKRAIHAYSSLLSDETIQKKSA